MACLVYAECWSNEHQYCDTLSGKYNNTLYGTINTNRLMIWCPVFDFRFENI